MKKVAKSKPIVVVPEVALPVEVRLALGIVPPHIARVGIAIKRNVQNIIYITADLNAI